MSETLSTLHDSALHGIVIASLVAGTMSVLAATSVARLLKTSSLPLLVSYAVGALLGAAFLEVLPHAVGGPVPASNVIVTVLAGILGFFVLEKLVLWRHCHHEHCEAHELTHRSEARAGGTLLMLGDTIHNFIDGVIIAGAFLADPALGIVTALAIIAHEIPQEAGNFLVLLHSGYSREEALRFNLVSSLGTLVGGLLGYALLAELAAGLPYLLAIAASSMIYVAVADLIPGLHERRDIGTSAQQVALIALGLGTVVFTGNVG
jgi:zinc and cadmium transporter